MCGTLTSANAPVTPQQLRLEAGVLHTADEEPGPSYVGVVLDLSLAGQEVDCCFLHSRRAVSALGWMLLWMAKGGCEQWLLSARVDAGDARLQQRLQDACHHAGSGILPR